MGRYLDLARQVKLIEPGKSAVTNLLVANSGYDKNDINDKRSDRRPTLPADRGDWSAEDWRAFIEERSAIAQHDGGLDRMAAEHTAFESAIIEWLNSHPEGKVDRDICCYCRHRLTDTDMLPVLNGQGEHVWLHSGCHQPFMEQRRVKAIGELKAMGLHAPSATATSIP